MTKAGGLRFGPRIYSTFYVVLNSDHRELLVRTVGIFLNHAVLGKPQEELLIQAPHAPTFLFLGDPSRTETVHTVEKPNTCARF